ncbi:MAG: serine/threonine protein kinase [Burkholderiales bacterium]|nr:serine/threonine protein kinase [Burkholderiales bacterium]
MLPDKIGRYEIISELGRGAMGVVYKARDPVLDRIVAIKTLSLNLSDDEFQEYEARFYQEAKATGKINHTNIISLFDFGKSDKIAFMAMEYLEGQELRQILDSGKRLDVERVLDIARQVAEGLSHAHEQNIVHRDIKPSNIMILRNGIAKITDFGIARIPSSAIKTMTGMVMGSPQYMSPEQVAGRHTDHRTDIFSLGIVLYEMLTGTPPFKGENVHSIMYQIVNYNPPPPKSLRPELPEMLDFIVAKALAKNPEDRYQSAKEFASDLKECSKNPVKHQETESFSAYFVEDTHDSADKSPTLGISRAFDSFEATKQLAILTDYENLSEIRRNREPGTIVLWAGFAVFVLIVIALIFMI